MSGSVLARRTAARKPTTSVDSKTGCDASFAPRETPQSALHDPTGTVPKGFARLPSDGVEQADGGKGPSGRWVDALLKSASSRGVGAVSAIPSVAGAAANPSQQHVKLESPQSRGSVTFESQPDFRDPTRRTHSGAVEVSPSSRATAVGVHPPLSRTTRRGCNTIGKATAAKGGATITTAGTECGTTTTAASPNGRPGGATSQFGVSPSDTPALPNSRSQCPAPSSGHGGSPGTTQYSAPSATPQRFVPSTAAAHPLTAVMDDREKTSAITDPLKPLQGGDTHSAAAGCIVRSTVVPHTASSLASSPFFERVTAPAPPPSLTSDEPRRRILGAGDDDDDSVMLHDITPIMSTHREADMLSPEGGTAGAVRSSAPFRSVEQTSSPYSQGYPGGSGQNIKLYNDASPWSATAYNTRSLHPTQPRHPVQSLQEFTFCERAALTDGFTKPLSPMFCHTDTTLMSGTPGGLSVSRSANGNSVEPRSFYSDAHPNFSSGAAKAGGTSPAWMPVQGFSSHTSDFYGALPAQGFPCVCSASTAVAPDLPHQRTTNGHNVSCVPPQRLSPEQYCHDAQGSGGVAGSSRQFISASSRAALQPSVWAARQPATQTVAPAAVASAMRHGPAVCASLTTPGEGNILPPPNISGLSSAALGKQLLHASKEELAQLLLELASCNADAARFIHSKAFFFTFRQEHGGNVEAETAATPAALEKPDAPLHSEGQQRTIESGAVALTMTNSMEVSDHRLPNNTAGRTTAPADARTTTLYSEATEDQRKSEHSTAVAAAVRHSYSDPTVNGRAIARCIFPAEVKNDEENDQHNAPLTKTTDAGPALSKYVEAQNGAAPSACVFRSHGARIHPQHSGPESREFGTDCHPCLRWYGGCRNSSSCVYASLPRNTCLNWIRSSCIAAEECSGVHRLPSPCPLEVQRIYDLNHGLLRRSPVDGHAMNTMSSEKRVPAEKALPLPPPFVSFAPIHATTAGGGISISPRAQRAAEGGGDSRVEWVTPLSLRNTEVLLTRKKDKRGEHTPRNQSINTGTFLEAGSTPHRHPHARSADGSRPVGHCDTDEKSRKCADTTLRSRGTEAGAAAPSVALPGSGVEQEMLQYTGGLSVEPMLPCLLHHTMTVGGGGCSDCAASPTGSTCSTAADGASRSHSVSRCLEPHFNRAETAVPEEVSPDAGVMASQVVNQSTAETHKNLPSICGVVGEALESRAPPPFHPQKDLAEDFGFVNLDGAPRRASAVLSEVNREEDEDDGHCAPAAGTRTRVQSPLYR